MDAWEAELEAELEAVQDDVIAKEVEIGTVSKALSSLDTEWADLYAAYGTLHDNYVQAQADLDAAQSDFYDETVLFNALHADFEAAQSEYTDLVADYDAASLLSGDKEATLVSYEDRTVAPKCLFGMLGWYMYCREFDEVDGEAAAEDDDEEAEEEEE